MKDIDKFIEKVQKSKADAKFDLSKDEDLSIAIMNLVSIEEHFFFTANKTEKDKYFDLLAEVRAMRQTLLKKIVPEYEGENWCISKHLLAASMRLMEVGTKEYGHGEKKEAKELFQKAYDLYSLFWGINLKVVDPGKIDKIADNKIDKEDESNGTIFSKLRGMVKKVIDCCIE